MNIAGNSDSCRVCGTNMLRAWLRERMSNPRVELSWQLDSGICQGCHVARQRAAIEYESAAAELRLWQSLGAENHGRGDRSRGRQVLAAAMHRIEAADARCVGLKMWPAARATKRPPWFYGDDERSNTE